MAIQGSCLCGTVRYEIGAPFTAMLSCHCSMCRKHHGAPFRHVCEHGACRLPLDERRAHARPLRGVAELQPLVLHDVRRGGAVADAGVPISRSCRPARSTAIRAFACRVTCSLDRRLPGTSSPIRCRNTKRIRRRSATFRPCNGPPWRRSRARQSAAAYAARWRTRSLGLR